MLTMVQCGTTVYWQFDDSQHCSVFFFFLQTLGFSKLTHRNLTLIRKRKKTYLYSRGIWLLLPEPSDQTQHLQQQDYLTSVPPNVRASPMKNSCQNMYNLNLCKLWDLTSSLREMQGIKEQSVKSTMRTSYKKTVLVSSKSQRAGGRRYVGR